MYYYFYKITNNINGKYYYGVHQTDDLNDGYMGSGVYLRRAYNKYGKSNFTKEIIHYFNNADDMFKYEAEIVNEDLLKDNNCYNISLGGHGGDTWTYANEDERKKRSINISNAQKNSKKFKESHKKAWTNNRRKLQSNKVKGENNPMYGKNAEDYMTPEAIKEKRRKLSKTMKDIYINNPELRKKQSLARLNKIIVNNGTKCKYIEKEEFKKYIDNGWKRGRLKR